MYSYVRWHVYSTCWNCLKSCRQSVMKSCKWFAGRAWEKEPWSERAHARAHDTNDCVVMCHAEKVSVVVRDTVPLYVPVCMRFTCTNSKNHTLAATLWFSNRIKNEDLTGNLMIATSTESTHSMLVCHRWKIIKFEFDWHLVDLVTRSKVRAAVGSSTFSTKTRNEYDMPILKSA